MSHMFNDKDIISQRRKREENQVELRRQRTGELLNKRREATCENTHMSSFEKKVKQMLDNDLNQVYEAVRSCRILLSTEGNPPIQSALDAGVLKVCAEMLYKHFYRKFGGMANTETIRNTRVEAAWIVTNIASGTTEQTLCVIDEGCVRPLVNMLSEGDDFIVDQSVWALGNIAGDCEAARNIVLKEDILSILNQLSERYRVSEKHIKVLRNIVWLMANLSRGRNPPPEKEVMQAIEGMIRHLVFINDREVVADCLWSLSYIVDVDSELANMMLSSNVMRRCYKLLEALAQSLENKQLEGEELMDARIGQYAICPIIRIIGNIITESDEATDIILRGGFIKFFKTIFYKYKGDNKSRVRKEICWVLSNITAGTHEQIVYVIEGELLGLLIDTIDKFELYIKKEACYAIKNIMYFCIKNYMYIQRMLDFRVLESLQSLLEGSDCFTEIQIQILDAVRYALEAGEELKRMTNENPVIYQMYQLEFNFSIEKLQKSPNQIISQKSYAILKEFFEIVE